MINSISATIVINNCEWEIEVEWPRERHPTTENIRVVDGQNDFTKYLTDGEKERYVKYVEARLAAPDMDSDFDSWNDERVS